MVPFEGDEKRLTDLRRGMVGWLSGNTVRAEGAVRRAIGVVLEGKEKEEEEEEEEED